MVDRGAVESRARRIDAELEVLEEARTGGREPYLRGRSLQREEERASAATRNSTWVSQNG